MGRFRGGLTSKIHTVLDACGLPIGLSLSEGQAYDSYQAFSLLSQLPAKAIVLADRAYDADAIRDLITGQGAFANIRPMSQRIREGFPQLHGRRQTRISTHMDQI